jgi:hypothetical protein
MLGESVQPGIELDLAGGAVVPHDQAAVVVEQHLLGDPAEVAEGPFQPGKPALLPLVADGANVQPARVAECGDEQYTLTLSPPISARRSPKSICICLPGGLSKRSVARARHSRAAAAPLRARPCAGSV